MFQIFNSLVAFISLALATTSTIANATSVCDEGYTSSARYSWCATAGDTSTALYYLHGNGESERSWGSAAHQQLIQKWGAKTPTVISVSFGPTWFFTHKSAQEFIGQVAPQIEQKLGIRPAARKLFGESMGGFNALQLYTFAPQFFSRFVAACPALLSFPPQASDRVVAAYIERHRPYVIPKLVTKWRDKLLNVYPSAREWDAHDPLRAATTKSASAPALFMYSNGLDVFGFQEATAMLAQTLNGVNAPVEYSHLPNTQHCQADDATLGALARFLAK